MKKYYVFRATEKPIASSEVGKQEDVACEIVQALIVADRQTPYYKCFEASSKECCLEMLRELPKYSLQLDQEKIEFWNGHLRNYYRLLVNARNQIDTAYGMIGESVNDVEEYLYSNMELRKLEIDFHVSLDDAFDNYINFPDEDSINEIVGEYFDLVALN